jgi:hypothetical protein
MGLSLFAFGAVHPIGNTWAAIDNRIGLLILDVGSHRLRMIGQRGALRDVNRSLIGSRTAAGLALRELSLGIVCAISSPSGLES